MSLHSRERGIHSGPDLPRRKVVLLLFEYILMGLSSSGASFCWPCPLVFIELLLVLKTFLRYADPRHPNSLNLTRKLSQKHTNDCEVPLVPTPELFSHH